MHAVDRGTQTSVNRRQSTVSYRETTPRRTLMT